MATLIVKTLNPFSKFKEKKNKEKKLKREGVKKLDEIIKKVDKIMEKVDEIMEITNETKKVDEIINTSSKQPIVRPIEDIETLTKLENICDSFWDKYKETSLSYVSSGMVDGKPILIALVRQSKDKPINLPEEFEGYRVLKDYGGIKPAHKSRHEELKPGISIGRDTQEDAFTLGLLFKTDDDVDRRYLLTVEHGIRGSKRVIQPGNLDKPPLSDDQVNLSSDNYCASVKFYKYGVGQNNDRFLDYAFCEIDGERTSIPNNTPFCGSVTINDYHRETNAKTNEKPFGAEVVGSFVRKVGRSTGCTNGYLLNRWRKFIPEGMNECVKALPVINGGSFCEEGDSGSPVFENKKLWGIVHGFPDSNSCNDVLVVPIDVILKDATERFEKNFLLV